MARSRWTFLLIAEEDTAPSRQFRLSRELVQIGIAAALLVVAGASSLGTGLLLRGASYRADARLVADNRLLRAELTDLHSSVDTLRTSLDGLYEKDQRFRLIAGLTPLDDSGLQVGMGSDTAATETAEDLPLYAVDPSAARHTFSVSSEIGALVRRAHLLSFSWREASDTLAEKQDRLAATPSITPTTGYITSGFSAARMHPLLRFARPHEGVDIVADMGTPIVAAARGRVRFAGVDNAYGRMVEIDHGYGVVTRYAHASVLLVHAGQMVERGDRIARVGQSGLAMGPHLHYEVIVNGQPTDPRRFLLDLRVVPD
jgi:murein DD-endopeptidase MepM/ murein hydrolase activator NlpD